MLDRFQRLYPELSPQELAQISSSDDPSELRSYFERHVGGGSAAPSPAPVRSVTGGHPSMTRQGKGSTDTTESSKRRLAELLDASKTLPFNMTDEQEAELDALFERLEQ